jgi:uncharacterized membrane protein
MLREKMAAKGLGGDKGFRWRGGEITRFEGLSDAVFAFAVTLLIVSLEVPKSFSDLLITMRGFFAFAICFGLLMGTWYQQYIYFRRYGLQDMFTIVVNSVLLFVVLFYIYPLKFLFTLLVNQFMGIPAVFRQADGTLASVIEKYQLPTLMIVYSAGFMAISLVFALLFWHAYRNRAQLDLNRLEMFDTRTSAGYALINSAVGLISILIAIIGGVEHAPWAGLIYPILLAPLCTVFGMVTGRRRKRFE